MSAIYEEIKDIICLKDDPEWPNMTNRRKAQVASLEIVEAACVVLRALSPGEADSDLPGLIEAAERLFDEYIVPLDMPIGDTTEVFFEMLARHGISMMITAFHNSL